MGTIVKENTYVDGTNARPEHVNEDLDTVFAVINGNIDWDNLKASLVNAANGILKLDASGNVALGQIPDILTGKDADTLDTKHYSQVATDIATHAAIAAAHHAKTVYADVEASVLAAIAAAGNGGVTDHGALTGLSDHDHPQYIRTSSEIDHGSVGGLAGNDHPQYLLTSRAMIGARGYLNSNQSIAHATATRITLTESWDIGADLSSSRYTAPYDGYYQVNAAIGYEPVATKYFSFMVKRNGTTVIEIHAHAVTTDSIVVTGSDIVYMTAGQYLELYAYHNGGESRNAIGYSRCTFMSVQLLCPTV